MQDFDIKNLIPVFIAVGIIVLILLIAIPISKSTGQKYIKVVGNLFWLILVGWELAIIFGIVGVICCVTILFIPVGIQYFKFARLAFWPFGLPAYWPFTTGIATRLSSLAERIHISRTSFACFSLELWSFKLRVGFRCRVLQSGHGRRATYLEGEVRIRKLPRRTTRPD